MLLTARVRGALRGAHSRCVTTRSSQQPPAAPIASELLSILTSTDINHKMTKTHAVYNSMRSSTLAMGGAEQLPDVWWHTLAAAVPDAPSLPPNRPPLVPPRQMQRRPADVPPNAFLLHAIAHIELNAVHLYVDTAARFGTRLPSTLRTQWLLDCLDIANDEATHFMWLVDRLKLLGHEYGSMPAHTGLWDAGFSTRDDVLARLAVVPLVQEARALDSEARLVQKLKSGGDAVSAAIVARICGEEVRHVALGMKWFTLLAQPPFSPAHSTAEPLGARFARYVQQHIGVPLPRPFNVRARDAAGIPQEWYEPLGFRPALR